MRVAVIVAVWLMTAPLLAQRGGRGGGDFGGGDLDGGFVPVQRSPFERLIDELDLDDETQVPAVRTLLQGVEREAAALFQELVTLRQDMLNVETNRSTDPAPAKAYAATATSLFALEARIFADIYALLTPGQKEKAAKGFDRLEALLTAALSVPAGGRGGAGPGGPGRGMPPGGGR
jgi:hypothetical protein